MALSWEGKTCIDLFPFDSVPFKQWWSGSGGPGRSQRVTTPHCSCGTTQTSRAWGAPPTDSVLEPELDTPQSQVKGGWLLLVCHFLDALQTLYNKDTTILVSAPVCLAMLCSRWLLPRHGIHRRVVAKARSGPSGSRPAAEEPGRKCRGARQAEKGTPLKVVKEARVHKEENITQRAT